MFDFMLKILPNGRILFRDSRDKSSKVLKPSEINSHLNQILVEEMVKEEETDKKIKEVKEKLGE